MDSDHLVEVHPLFDAEMRRLTAKLAENGEIIDGHVLSELPSAPHD